MNKRTLQDLFSLLNEIDSDIKELSGVPEKYWFMEVSNHLEHKWRLVDDVITFLDKKNFFYREYVNYGPFIGESAVSFIVPNSWDTGRTILVFDKSLETPDLVEPENP